MPHPCDNDGAPMKVECYEIDRLLSASEKAVTEDGWEVRYHGTKINPGAQSITATKAGQTITLKTYWGSEGVAQTLIKARNANLPDTEHPD